MDDVSRQGMLSPLWVMGAILGLVAFWVPFTASQTASKTGDVLVRTFHNLLPAFALTTCVGGFLVVPLGDPVMRGITLWTHHTSFLMLFLFLIAAEYFQMEAWWKIRRAAPIESVAASYSRLWMLTEIVPAPIALVIFLTGLRLIQESRETNSPSTFWLLALILSFSMFFWDGIFGYTPIVRNLRERWQQASSQGLSADSAARTVGGAAEVAQLLPSLCFLAIRLSVGRISVGVPQLAERPRGWDRGAIRQLETYYRMARSCDRRAVVGSDGCRRRVNAWAPRLFQAAENSEGTHFEVMRMLSSQSVSNTKMLRELLTIQQVRALNWGRP